MRDVVIVILLLAIISKTVTLLETEQVMLFNLVEVSMLKDVLIMAYCDN